MLGSPVEGSVVIVHYQQVRVMGHKGTTRWRFIMCPQTIHLLCAWMYCCLDVYQGMNFLHSLDQKNSNDNIQIYLCSLEPVVFQWIG